MDVRHKIVIDFAKRNYIEIEIAKASENSTVLELYLVNQGKEIKTEDIAIVTVSATTPSEANIFKELDISDKYVLYPISKGIQNEPGKTVCELQVTGWDGVTINSFEFYINVKQSVLEDGMLVTADEITAVKTCVVRAEKAAVASEEAEQNIKEKEQQLLEDTQVAKDTKEKIETYMENLQEEIEKGKFIGAPGIQGPPGEQGKEGKRGPRGEQGLQGESGIVTPTSGFFTLSVAENGDVYASCPDGENPPEFEMDDNGNVYWITTDDNEVLIGNVKGPQGESGKNVETDDKYFDIDYDGLISLKPEYRGAMISANYPYAISDNGVGVNGSKISELPQRLVIPSNINGEQVTGFQNGMFCCNERVEQIVLPKTIKDIPAGFCRYAIHLEIVKNTEHIEKVGSGAFYTTRIREMLLPNLKSINANVFYSCYCLLKVDLGKTITTLPQSTFQYCDNLQEVKGGNAIKIVNKYAFYSTRRLKHVEFLQNLTQIDTNAFVGCALDFEEVYPTLVANGCTFGTYATYKQFNDTDYWSGATFTPCRNELNSLFHQTDPRWADKTIGNYVDENGEPCTYANNGCAFCTLAEIYSAFEGVEFESPEEFLQILESKNLTHLDFRYRTGWCQIANELGYQTEYISIMTTADLQKVYDELSQGALVYRSLGVMNQPDGGHATLVYGVNSNGEMLMSETSMHCYDVGIYENHKSAWHVYKHGSAKCDVVIVKKT